MRYVSIVYGHVVVRYVEPGPVCVKVFVFVVCCLCDMVSGVVVVCPCALFSLFVFSVLF